ncbi:SOS response-associated peptidase [Myxococcota bacterium]|nr:SOS response-associated peptidase [Myxococcota bacterium]
MCGRFTLTSTPEQLAEVFELDEVECSPRYNIAPSQEILNIHGGGPGGGRGTEVRRWGLIPSWAKDARIASHCFNARAETVAEKPAFRDSFRYRRCLIPADGFYEWERVAGGGRAQPYHITSAVGGPFAMAGIWDAWEPESGDRTVSCAVITVPANRELRELHSRMPVILGPESFGVWLDGSVEDPEVLLPRLESLPDGSLSLRPVDARVNDARHDTVDCLAPFTPPPTLAQGELF